MCTAYTASCQLTASPKPWNLTLPRSTTHMASTASACLRSTPTSPVASGTRFRWTTGSHAKRALRRRCLRSRMAMRHGALPGMGSKPEAAAGCGQGAVVPALHVALKAMCVVKPQAPGCGRRRVLLRRQAAKRGHIGWLVWLGSSASGSSQCPTLNLRCLLCAMCMPPAGFSCWKRRWRNSW